MLADGAGPDRSAFLSAFFALVGCHGLHVTIGLLWLGTMMAQFCAKGFRPTSCAAACASRCSGTRSTSSGSASSPTSIFWGRFTHERPSAPDDAAPGEGDIGAHSVAEGDARNYLIGLALAAVLTVALVLGRERHRACIYGPGVPMALAALAVAQMGVHLVFFLHITTGPDNTNNALALAFGALIVGIVIAGSLWIMYHLNANMMPPSMWDMNSRP